MGMKVEGVEGMLREVERGLGRLKGLKRLRFLN